MALLTNLCGSVPTAMADITDGCLNLGEVQRIYFQRTYSSGTTENKFTIASANPNVIATWTTPLAAVDGTKVLAPNTIIHAPSFSKGNKIEFGGNGETAGGIPIAMGAEPGVFTCNLLYRAAQTVEGFIDLQGENLSVFFELEDGRIIGQVDDNGTPTIFKGIKIEQIFIGDREGDSRTQPGFNVLEFYLPYRWSKYLYAVTPSDFTARTAIVNS
jgi:hypothetical protein